MKLWFLLVAIGINAVWIPISFSADYEVGVQGTDNLCIVRWKKDKYREALSKCKKGDWIVARREGNPNFPTVVFFAAENCVMETLKYHPLNGVFLHCVYRGAPRTLSGTETDFF